MTAERNHLPPQTPPPAMAPTEVHQVWYQLAPTQQQQILQRIVQICQMLAHQAPKTREVQHELLE